MHSLAEQAGDIQLLRRTYHALRLMRRFYRKPSDEARPTYDGPEAITFSKCRKQVE